MSSCDSPSIVVRQGQEWCETATWSTRLQRPEWLPKDVPIALHVPDSVFTVSAISWFLQNRMQAALIPAERSSANAFTLAAQCGCYALLTGSPGGWQWSSVNPSIGERNWGTAKTGGLLLLTSGTTGEPKRIFHSWESLLDGIAEAPQRDNIPAFFTLYPLTRFAGLTTVLQALKSESVLCLPTAHDAGTLSRELVRERPTHLSGTPTLWRTLLIYLPEDEDWRHGVEHVTLGGEIADYYILGSLHRYFPKARITHVYASTEAGICLSVSDGLPGFPAAWLNREHRNVSMRVENGQLFVRRHGARSDALSETWWPTGDRVALVGDRVRFLGRDSELLNVGGAKVAPAEVEACISDVPGVAAVRVFGIPSSFAGTLVTAEIVPQPGEAEHELRILISRRCREHLAPYAVPRSLRFVPALAVSNSGKLDRSSSI